VEFRPTRLSPLGIRTRPVSRTLAKGNNDSSDFTHQGSLVHTHRLIVIVTVGCPVRVHLDCPPRRLLNTSLHVSVTRRQTPILLVPQSTTSHLVLLFLYIQESLKRDREPFPATTESATPVAASRKLWQCALYPVNDFVCSTFLFCNALAPLLPKPRSKVWRSLLASHQHHATEPYSPSTKF